MNPADFDTSESRAFIEGLKVVVVPPLPPRVDGPSRSWDDDGMEARLIKLEEFADDAKQRLARVETKLDHIDNEVSNFKWWAAGSAVAIILAMIAAVLGTGIAIQQMTVSTFQAAGSQSQPTPQQQPIIINVPQAAPAQPAAPAAPTTSSSAN